MSRGLVALLVLGAVVPFAVSMLVLFRRGASYAALSKWRRFIWLAGALLALVISLTAMLWIGTQLSTGDDGERFAALYGSWLVANFVGAPLALLLVSFGRGRSRWLGMVSPILSMAFLFVASTIY